MKTENKFAVIEHKTWYGSRPTIHLVSVHDGKAAAEQAADELRHGDMPYCLSHNQSGGWYDFAEVLDDDACYQTWLDSRNWDGCPSEDGSDYAANCEWAEEQAIDHGGTLPVQDPRGGLVLVQLPATANN